MTGSGLIAHGLDFLEWVSTLDFKIRVINGRTVASATTDHMIVQRVGATGSPGQVGE